MPRSSGVSERLPLGRELGERVVHRVPGLLRPIDQQGDRRHHLGVDQERDHRIGVGRAFDEDDARLDRLECLPDAPRRARPVMADAQDVDGAGGLGSGGGERGHGRFGLRLERFTDELRTGRAKPQPDPPFFAADNV